VSFLARRCTRRLPPTPYCDRGRTGEGTQRLDTKAVPKILLTRLGAVCGQGLVYNLNGAFNYLHAGWWLHEHGLHPAVRVRSRYDVFERVAAEIAERRVLYLSSE
jgi:hypothetical protein